MTPEEKAVIDLAIRSREVALAGLPSVADEMREAIDALIYSCPECNAGGHTCPGDGNPIGHTQTNCGQHEERDTSANWRVVRDVGHEWVPATFGDLWPGDRVRIGTQEADVTKVSRGDWHARNRVWIDDAGRERDHQTPWEHEELNIDLTANPGMHDYDPGIACEILADADRRAALIIQQAFPGTNQLTD